MIIVTGGAGFIGSYVAEYLHKKGKEDIVLADNFSVPEKQGNYINKPHLKLVERDELFEYIQRHITEIKFVIHLGARTDTVDQDPLIFDVLNLKYSKVLWKLCTEHGIPFIYASSAATYGNGEFGFDDEMEDISLLKPMNEYGRSKQFFDEWALSQKTTPPYWVGLKFFNVYGPNEYHKGRMASVIFHAFNQIKGTGGMKLFKSHRSDYEDGMQRRDFIYVADVAAIIHQLMSSNVESGIYNLGTGQSRTFLDLVRAVFAGMKQEEQIDFIDIPEDIRENYQYFTEAKMDKMKNAGINHDYYSLELGIKDYVESYLISNKYF